MKEQKLKLPLVKQSCQVKNKTSKIDLIMIVSKKTQKALHFVPIF
jgi:hypothetical protein